MGAFNDLSGGVFGMLNVVRRAEQSSRHTMYECTCQCGVTKVLLAKNLVNGRSKSCGCVRGVEAHGFCNTATYRTWVGMKQRCNNPKATGYERWGGRGIVVCQRWVKFSCFLEDMGERPVGTTLERVDNDRGYEPGNCVWATYKQQANNRRPRSAKK